MQKAKLNSLRLHLARQAGGGRSGGGGKAVSNASNRERFSFCFRVSRLAASFNFAETVQAGNAVKHLRPCEDGGAIDARVMEWQTYGT